MEKITVKEIRKKHDLTQEQLSEILNISQEYISQIENDSLESKTNILEFALIGLDYYLENENPSFKNPSITYLKKKFNLTQEKISSLLKTSQAYISKLEKEGSVTGSKLLDFALGGLESHLNKKEEESLLKEDSSDKPVLPCNSYVETDFNGRDHKKWDLLYKRITLSYRHYLYTVNKRMNDRKVSSIISSTKYKKYFKSLTNYLFEWYYESKDEQWFDELDRKLINIPEKFFEIAVLPYFKKRLALPNAILCEGTYFAWEEYWEEFAYQVRENEYVSLRIPIFYSRKSRTDDQLRVDQEQKEKFKDCFEAVGLKPMCRDELKDFHISFEKHVESGAIKIEDLRDTQHIAWMMDEDKRREEKEARIEYKRDKRANEILKENSYERYNIYQMERMKVTHDDHKFKTLKEFIDYRERQKLDYDIITAERWYKAKFKPEILKEEFPIEEIHKLIEKDNKEKKRIRDWGKWG